MSTDVKLDSELLALISANRIFPDDTPLAILRRLLKLDKTPGGWVGQGVFLPNGTKVRMGYGSDPTLNGEIKAGQWLIAGRKFASPSTAATSFVAKTRGRKNARVNGWLYWQVKPPGEHDYILLDALRVAAETTATAKAAHNVVPLSRGAHAHSARRVS